MPIAIAIRFPSGRFHATPWGHHVNEGLPEWPPSPWRLLRALVATWKRKLADDAGVGAALPGILARLTAPPGFYLPPATLGHTRHYMPFKGSNRRMVFDAFVALDRDAEVVFLWPEVSLEPDEQRALEAVLRNLGFFGRAESWCETRIHHEWWDEHQGDDVNFGANCRPLSGPTLPPGTEPVRVLAPDPATWDGWSYHARRRRPDPPWNLLAETADLHAERWSDPPGSGWLVYVRPSDAFRPASLPRPRPKSTHRPTVARFLIDAPVLPPIEQTLPLAEQVRRALMARCKVRSEVFSGKDEGGNPLRMDHQHAYYLPADEEGTARNRITHVTVFARMGFGEDELRAIDGLKRLVWPPGDWGTPATREGRWQAEFGSGGVSLELIGLGDPDDFRSSPLFRKSKVWESATPFVVTRHLKRRGRHRDRPELLDPAMRPQFVEEALRGELARQPGMPPIDRIEWLARGRMAPATESFSPPGSSLLDGRRPVGDNRATRPAPIRFHRTRRRRGDDGGSRPFGEFRISFDAPAAGPIILGHSCHFGLGLFTAPNLPVPRPGEPS